MRKPPSGVATTLLVQSDCAGAAAADWPSPGLEPPESQPTSAKAPAMAASDIKRAEFNILAIFIPKDAPRRACNMTLELQIKP